MTKTEKAEQISACFLTPAFLQFKHNKSGVRLEAIKTVCECLISLFSYVKCRTKQNVDRKKEESFLTFYQGRELTSNLMLHGKSESETKW